MHLRVAGLWVIVIGIVVGGLLAPRPIRAHPADAADLLLTVHDLPHVWSASAIEPTEDDQRSFCEVERFERLPDASVFFISSDTSVQRESGAEATTISQDVLVYETPAAAAQAIDRLAVLVNTCHREDFELSSGNPGVTFLEGLDLPPLGDQSLAANQRFEFRQDHHRFSQRSLPG